MALPPDMLPHPHELAGGSYYPEMPHDITGGLPINLDSLRDGPPGSKPFYPYSTLIRYAIKGSPTGKLLLEDIYYAIESRFPYFRSAPAGWKNSVRHNLSLNPCFVKVARPLTDRGKGSYWTVDDNVDPRTGVHRVRKKKKRSSDGEDGHRVGEHSPDPELSPSAGSSSAQDGSTPHAAYEHPPEPGHPPAPQYEEQYPPPGGPLDEHGDARAPHVGFDMHYQHFEPPAYMLPVGFPPALPPVDTPFELDEHGMPDWPATWRRELAALQQATEEQEKAPEPDAEWFRLMICRVRGLPSYLEGDVVLPMPGRERR